MSAVRGTSGKLSAGPLAGISRDTTHLMIGWSKYSTTPSGSYWCMLDMNATGVANTGPVWRGEINAAGKYSMSVSGAPEIGGGSLILNQWVHYACWFERFGGSSQSLRTWVNGALLGNVGASTSSQTNDLAHVSFFVYVGSLTQRESPVGTKLAEWAIFSGLTTTQRDTIIAEAQTKHVGALSITPTHAWRLLNDGTAAVGGGDLTITNAITFDTDDHPPVGASPPPAPRRRVLWVG